MKSGRQQVIIDLVTHQNIENQQQLLCALAEQGIYSTQATLSRDLRDLRLEKKPGPDGKCRYTLPEEQNRGSTQEETLRSMLRHSVISADTAQNLIVVHTHPGLASAGAAAIDTMALPGLVGTIAGDDTVFIAMKTTEAAESLAERIHELV